MDCNVTFEDPNINLVTCKASSLRAMVFDRGPLSGVEIYEGVSLFAPYIYCFGTYLDTKKLMGMEKGRISKIRDRLVFELATCLPSFRSYLVPLHGQ